MAIAKRKLQVFVSSTYIDLKEERQAAVEAILGAGHIPAGMELFAAGDESQITVIQRWIDESDVYMLILGTRYGSLDKKTSKSYTQLEYEYAVHKRKPLFACVIKEGAVNERIKSMGSAAIDEHGTKLKSFREDVLSRMCKLWSDPKDIALAIYRSMSDFERQESLAGWVKGDQAVDPLRMEQMAQEIARLSAENSNLRANSPSATPMTTFMGLSYQQAKERLKKVGILKSFLDLREQKGIDAAFSKLPDGKQELFNLGLIKSQENGGRELTWEGQAFLNLYAAEKDGDTGALIT